MASSRAGQNSSYESVVGVGPKSLMRVSSRYCWGSKTYYYFVWVRRYSMPRQEGGCTLNAQPKYAVHNWEVSLLLHHELNPAYSQMRG